MIVLTMIVKDEAHVIRRCLESVIPFIDAYVIADTGSTDETVAIVRDALSVPGMNGFIMRQEWEDFSTNRNRVLEAARELVKGIYWPNSSDLGRHYALTIDADEVLTDVPLGSVLANHPSGQAYDGFTVDVEYAGTQYRRLALANLASPWEWQGPVHELLHMEGANIAHLTHPTITVYHEGARSRDPETYVKDAALLRDALLEDPDNPRYQFYLAESYRYAGMLHEALLAYERRARNLGGWDQERYMSLLNIGRLRGHLAPGDRGQVLSALLDAFETDTRRAEALVELARFERYRERWHVAAMFASWASRMDAPEDALFIERDAYSWIPWDEVAISLFYGGHLELALDAAEEALERDPDSHHLQENLRLIQEAIK